MKAHKWGDLLILAEYAAKDAPPELAQTDPALYRLLRQQITEYRIRGWHLLNPVKLRELINEGGRHQSE